MRATRDGPEESIAQKSNDKFRKGKTQRSEMPEDSRITPEPEPAREKSPIKMPQESKLSHKRSRRSKILFTRVKRSQNKYGRQKQDGLSTINRLKVQQKDALSPGTSKKLDFTEDSIAATGSAGEADAAPKKASVTKAKPRHWRKKDT